MARYLESSIYIYYILNIIYQLPPARYLPPFMKHLKIILKFLHSNKRFPPGKRNVGMYD